MATKKDKTTIRYLYEGLIKLQQWLISHSAKTQRRQEDLTPQAIVWAYRLFLDREPESQEVVYNKLRRFTDSQELRQEFMHSYEFKQKNPVFHSPALSGDEPPMLIEDVYSEMDLQALFNHIQNSWQYLGETEPYWSVWTSKKFDQYSIHTSKDLFYNSGKLSVTKFFGTLDRNGIDYTAFKSCLDYGCGLARVTRWLSEKFEKVFGYDISQSHLQIAEKYLVQEGIHNVILHHIKQISDIRNLPRIDCIYSLISLQHNPPPMISLVIREFIKSLNSGGIAFFQVPTYQLGYSFVLSKYLSDESTRVGMEMHVLPQSRVFEIIRQEGGKIIEVIEDSFTMQMYKNVSNTFLVQKE